MEHLAPGERATWMSGSTAAAGPSTHRPTSEYSANAPSEPASESTPKRVYRCCQYHDNLANHSPGPPRRAPPRNESAIQDLPQLPKLPAKPGVPPKPEEVTGGAISHAPLPQGGAAGVTAPPPPPDPPEDKKSQKRWFYEVDTAKVKFFWDRLRGKTRPPIPVRTSILNILKTFLLGPECVISAYLLFIPFAWTSHFHSQWGHSATFALSFLSIVPLERMFDWGAEQMSYYLGEELGELLIITLNNAVEATLAIILLVKCELRLLQTTIVGVVILHLLMIPGTAFLVDGMRVWQQELSEHSAELNHSLLLLGIMAILLPTAFFAALDRGYLNPTSGGFEQTLVNDSTRDELLRMSRGLSVLLLIVYVCSRIFIHTTSAAAEKEKKAKEEPKAVASGQKASMESGQTLRHRGKSDELYDEEKSIEGKGASSEGEGKDEEHAKEPAPKIGPGVCFLFLVLTVGLMAVTAEFLVESVEFIRDESGIQQEWFGLILLPNVSFAADGVTAVVDYFWTMVPHLTGRKTQEPERVAKARAIDLSIQFALFWMPLLVLLGWWISKPMHLLFDYFELALLLGACFLVNYVTADAKTNWVEGLAMVVFYIMIAICAWFYPGQPEATIMLTCPGSVAGALATNVTGSG